MPKPKLKTEEEYQAITKSGQFPNLTTDDMKWIDENVPVENNDLSPQDFMLDEQIAEEEQISQVPIDNSHEERGGEVNNMPQEVDYDSYVVPSGGGGNFLKTEAGDNRIRLCSKPLELKLHESGQGSGYKAALCKGDKCELCGKGVKTKYKYAYIVLNRKDGKPYVYEAPLSVFKQIIAFATDPEYGDPEQYDLTIKRSGEGLETNYMVIASPKKVALTDEELETLGQSGISLETAYAGKL